LARSPSFLIRARHWFIDAEGNQTPSRFRVEAEAQGFQQPVKPGSRIHALTLPELPHTAGHLGA